MFNRLGGKASAKREDLTGDELVREGQDVSTDPGMQSSFMQNFFRQVDVIRHDLEAIKLSISEIERSHKRSLDHSDAPRSGSEDALRKLMDSTAERMQGVKGRLLAMRRDADGGSKGDSEARVRENLHQTLSKKFVALSQEYQEMQTRYKEKYRERVGRQLRVVKPDATKAEVDAAMVSGGEGIFRHALLQQRSDAAAKNALADIQDKHKDIMRLEQSLVELHQLFIDMATLVESQGEMLDQIEYSVDQAQATVNSGVEQLAKASASQRRFRLGW